MPDALGYAEHNGPKVERVVLRSSTNSGFGPSYEVYEQSWRLGFAWIMDCAGSFTVAVGQAQRHAEGRGWPLVWINQNGKERTLWEPRPDGDATEFALNTFNP
jgi:hypothetical protein